VWSRNIKRWPWPALGRSAQKNIISIIYFIYYYISFLFVLFLLLRVRNFHYHLLLMVLIFHRFLCIRVHKFRRETWKEETPFKGWKGRVILRDDSEKGLQIWTGLMWSGKGISNVPLHAWSSTIVFNKAVVFFTNSRPNDGDTAWRDVSLQQIKVLAKFTNTFWKNFFLSPDNILKLVIMATQNLF
jgi:hypothetical protein